MGITRSGYSGEGLPRPLSSSTSPPHTSMTPTAVSAAAEAATTSAAAGAFQFGNLKVGNVVLQSLGFVISCVVLIV